MYEEDGTAIKRWNESFERYCYHSRKGYRAVRGETHFPCKVLHRAPWKEDSDCKRRRSCIEELFHNVIF
jgi:hypothetical protein